jgi:phospholipase/carboxylesterase
MTSHLPCIETGASREDAELTVILMHGLGADGHDFADVAEALVLAAQPKKWRFVLPHAPQIPLTINMGMTMPAWYDILDMSQPREVDWESVQTSQTNIEAMIAHEKADNIILAGFSQGGAMALHVGLRSQKPIAGIFAMSGYLLESADHPCPPKTDTEIPIGLFHGDQDQVVPFSAAGRTKEALENAGYTASLDVYQGMAHSVCDEEIRDVFEWLQKHF